MSDSNFGVNYTEFLVEREKDANIRKTKLFIFLGSVAYSALMFWIMFVLTKLPVLFIPYILILVIGIWYFSRYTKIEYEYVIASASFSVDKILARSKRKKILDIKIKDFKKIAPYEEFDKYSNGKIEEVFCGSSKKSPDLYFAEYFENGTRKAVVFDATKKALNILKFYNSSVITIKPVRY